MYFLQLYIINCFSDACSHVFLEQQAHGRARSEQCCSSVLSFVLAPNPILGMADPPSAHASPSPNHRPSISCTSPVGYGGGTSAPSSCCGAAVGSWCRGCLSVCACRLSGQAVLQDGPEQDSAGACAAWARCLRAGCRGRLSSSQDAALLRELAWITVIPNRSPLCRKTSFPL